MSVCLSQPSSGVFPFLQHSVCQNVTYTLGYVVAFRLGRYLEGRVSSCQLHCKRNRHSACQKQIAVTSTADSTKTVLTIETEAHGIRQRKCPVNIKRGSCWKGRGETLAAVSTDSLEVTCKYTLYVLRDNLNPLEPECSLKF